MDKLTLTCGCGQELLVPSSAMHQVGLCPYCGAEILIGEDNTRKHEGVLGPGRLLSMRKAQRREKPEDSEQSWRRFAEAVDLYNNRRYAEALTLLNTLYGEFPGNPHIDTARNQCLNALQRSANALQVYDGERIGNGALSPELIKSVVLDKLVNSQDETVQLRAAELAAKMLGMFPNGHAPKLESSDAAPDIILRPRALPADERAAAREEFS